MKGENSLGLEQPELDEKESSKGLGLGEITGQEMMTESLGHWESVTQKQD